MNKARMETFSDGVIAIILTIMVLELKAPHNTEWTSIIRLAPAFLSYVLSFVYIGIYWNNHHHLLQVIERVNGKILWANLHLLFWLTLVPFVTTFMGENHVDSFPVALYGLVLFFTAIAFQILSSSLIALHGRESFIASALGRNLKGWLSLILYAAGVVLAFDTPWISIAIYVLVALLWFIPDRRIEDKLQKL